MPCKAINGFAHHPVAARISTFWLYLVITTNLPHCSNSSWLIARNKSVERRLSSLLVCALIDELGERENWILRSATVASNLEVNLAVRHGGLWGWNLGAIRLWLCLSDRSDRADRGGDNVFCRCTAAHPVPNLSYSCQFWRSFVGLHHRLSYGISCTPPTCPPSNL